MEIDYDRLQKVKTSAHHDRGDGRTFAICHDIIEMAKSDDQTTLVIWPIPNYSWTDHIKPMLTKMARHYCIDISWQRSYKARLNHNHIELRLIVPKAVNTRRLASRHTKILETYNEFFDYADKENIRAWIELATAQAVYDYPIRPPSDSINRHAKSNSLQHYRWLAVVRRWWGTLVE